MYGLDYLGLPKFVDLAVREHPAGWAAGCFANTFGNALPAVRRLLETGRCPLFRVHLLWSDTHSFGAAEIPTVRRLAREYEILKRAFPQVVIEISPFCEHNLTNPDQYLEIVASEAPSCVPVNTPYKGAVSRKFKNEVHGSHAAPRGGYNYSWDGTSCVDGDVEKSKETHKSAQVYFFWLPQFNLRKNTNDTTPRPERKAVPTSNLIDSVIYLHRTKGETSLNRRHIWKSHADQHSVPVPEPRAHKPVFITPVDARRIELVADNGQVIAVMPRTSNFTDGRPLYRLPEFGYVVAEKAIRIHGKPTVKLVANGKQIGVVNPAYRDGAYR
jgi:hypothetical protein